MLSFLQGFSSRNTSSQLPSPVLICYQDNIGEYQFLKLYYLLILKGFGNHAILNKIKIDKRVDRAQKVDNMMDELLNDKKKSDDRLFLDKTHKKQEKEEEMGEKATIEASVLEKIDKQLIEVYEAFSLNIFRFVFNNV